MWLRIRYSAKPGRIAKQRPRRIGNAGILANPAPELPATFVYQSKESGVVPFCRANAFWSDGAPISRRWIGSQAISMPSISSYVMRIPNWSGSSASACQSSSRANHRPRSEQPDGDLIVRVLGPKSVDGVADLMQRCAEKLASHYVPAYLARKEEVWMRPLIRVPSFRR